MSLQPQHGYTLEAYFSTLHSAWCQVDAVSRPIDNQLCHGEAAGRGVQEPPAAMQAQINLDSRIRRSSAERLEYVRSMSAMRCSKPATSPREVAKSRRSLNSATALS